MIAASVARVSQTGSPWLVDSTGPRVSSLLRMPSSVSADRNVIEEAERKLYENEEFLAMDYDDDVAAYDAAHGIK